MQCAMMIVKKYIDKSSAVLNLHRKHESYDGAAVMQFPGSNEY